MRHQGSLFGFQRFNLAGQGIELLLLLITQLGRSRAAGRHISVWTGRFSHRLALCGTRRLRSLLIFLLLGRPGGPIAIAANELAPPPFALGGDDLRDNIVEKASVMADQQNGALIIL